MPFEPITRDEFERLRPPPSDDPQDAFSDPIGWYATPDRSMLGMVYCTKSSPCNYAAFGRDDAGSYLCFGAGTGVRNVSDAVLALNQLADERATADKSDPSHT
jgi:hypothetical protein